MKIFLSWSGDRSKAVASALRNWLPLVLHYAKPWLSQQDIQAGDRWSVEVGSELNESHFGIICLTPENLTMPWMLFEAGAISKSFSQGAVCPYLYDVDYSALTGPLQQFQSKKADCASTKELVESINAKSTTPIDPTTLDTLFDTLWPRLENQLSNIPAESMGLQRSRPQPEILEELVKSVRAMEGRFREFGERLKFHDSIIAPITKYYLDASKIAFVVDAKGEVGLLTDGERITMQIHASYLISAMAKHTGLKEEKFGDSWILRDQQTKRRLTREDILELAVKYEEQVCFLRVEKEDEIPF